MIVFVLVLLTKRTVVLGGRFVALSSAKRQSGASAQRRICTCSEAYKSVGFFIFVSLFAIFYILLKQRTPAYFATTAITRATLSGASRIYALLLLYSTATSTVLYLYSQDYKTHYYILLLPGQYKTPL